MKKYEEIKVDNERSIGAIILEMNEKRPRIRRVDIKLMKKSESAMLALTRFFMTIDLLKEYEYGELIKHKQYDPLEKHKRHIKSQNKTLYGEIPTLSYLLEKNRWAKLSQRMYKKCINALLSQCISYSTARIIVDTQPLNTIDYGSIFSLKPKFGDKQ